jgi:hypothetical protein
MRELLATSAKTAIARPRAFPFSYFILIKNCEPSASSERHRGAQRKLPVALAIVLVITHGRQHSDA